MLLVTLCMATASHGGSDYVDLSRTSPAEDDCCTEFLHFCFTPIWRRQKFNVSGRLFAVQLAPNWSQWLPTASKSNILAHKFKTCSEKWRNYFRFHHWVEMGDPWCLSAAPFDKTVHCQSWLTNHAEEWHQVSESHNWPRACRRTHSNGKHQMSSMWEHAKGKAAAYMALPYQRLLLPWKEFAESWSAKLTTVLRLFSLTASRVHWLSRMGWERRQ